MACRFHIRKLNLIIVFVILGLTGCSTSGITNYVSTNNYVSAGNADKVGDHKKAFELYKAATADSNSPYRASAQYRLAQMYMEGEGTSKDPQKALTMYQVVANSNDDTWRPHALYALGEIYKKGMSNGDERDRARAFKLYKAVTNNPDYPEKAGAQYRLAQMYMEGEGTSKDPQKALAMYQVVANSNDDTWRPQAFYALGNIYEKGISGIVEMNRVQAANWYSQAAEAGYKLGQRALDQISEHPDVYVAVHKDEYFVPASSAPAGMARANKHFENSEYKAALEIFLWHARNGNAGAQANAALMFRDGVGTKVDAQNHTAWAYLAAKNGNARAQYRLEVMYYQGQLVPGSDQEAEKWFLQSAKQDLSEGYNGLGVLALRPFDEGAKSETAKALRYFEKAAKLGSSVALLNLGDLYFEGTGTQRDLTRAKKLYIQAAQKGVTAARTRLFEKFSIVFDPEKYEPPQSGSFTKRKVNAPPAQTTRKETDRASRTEQTELSPVELFALLSPSVFPLVALTDKKSSQGSAIALTENLAVTNCHVVAEDAVIRTKINDKLIYFGRPFGDRQKDICFIASEQKLRPVSATRNYSDLKVGEKVYAIGSPRGLKNSFSEGIISGLRTERGVSAIQTSAAMSQGSSGGALFDAQGRLIGITSFQRKKGQSLNFAIAIDEALKLMPSRTAHAR